MKGKQVSPTSAVAQPIKYAPAGVLALIAVIVLAMLMPAPRVLAQSESDLPFGLQSGLTTAHLDKSGIPIGGSGLPWGLQSGLASARGMGYVSSLHLGGGKGLPFGLQSGLVTASGVGYVASLDLVGGQGVPFGLQSGLATAGLDKAGQSLAGVERGIDADSARYAAMGRYYLGLAGDTVLAENPELILARRVPAVSSDAILAANPELILARRVPAVSGATILAASPDLILQYADIYPELVKAYFDKLDRGAAADAARWQAMGTYYVGLAAAGTGLERGAAADAARWQAMGAYYVGLAAAGTGLETGR